MNKNHILTIVLLLSFNSSFLRSDDNLYNQSRTPSIRRVQDNWVEVQKKARDAVVQVFSMVALFDWCEPYRTPEQKGCTGSGFFINEQGDIITNAHVVDQAVAVWVSIPSLGQKPLRVTVLSIIPKLDLALLRLDEESRLYVKKELGSISYLNFGDSNKVNKVDEALALGYPYGVRSLKSTLGVISGSWGHYIQMDTPINPGNSGGPLLNSDGEVIGVNSAIITESQNIGFAIPSNIVKIQLSNMYNNGFVQMPWLGLVTSCANRELTDYLGNPQPGGCFVCDVKKNSIVDRAGIQKNDMIYEINGYPVDIYGDITVDWSTDKLGLHDYLAYLYLGQEISFLIYRDGCPLTVSAVIENSQKAPIEKKYPWYQDVDYELFAGMVVMELTYNHIAIFSKDIPALQIYGTLKHQNEPRLIITNVFPDSKISQQNIAIGSTLNEVNGQKVTTLEEFRNALYISLTTGMLTMRITDEAQCLTDNILVVLPLPELCAELHRLAPIYRFPISETAKDICKKVKEQYRA